jgi:hypothetical protein
MNCKAFIIKDKFYCEIAYWADCRWHTLNHKKYQIETL